MLSLRNQTVEPSHHISSAARQPSGAALSIFDGVPDARLELATKRLDPLEHLADLTKCALDRKEVALHIQDRLR